MSMNYDENQEPRAADAPGRLQKHFVIEVIDSETGEVTFEPDKGKTRQEFKEETDINVIVERMTDKQATDWLEQHEEWLKSAVDQTVPNIEYRELLAVVMDAEERFLDLPADVRAGFNNDPAEFMEFVQSEGGDIELAELVAKSRKKTKKAGSVAKASEPEPAHKQAAPARPTEDPPSSGGDG